jgi:hypothetical protein
VFRIEKREPESPYSEQNKDQLAEIELQKLLDEKRAQTTIDRSLDGDDIAYAEDHL